MTAAPDIGLEPVADAPKLPPVYLSNGNPLKVISECRRAAKRGALELAPAQAVALDALREAFDEATVARMVAVAKGRFTLEQWDEFAASFRSCFFADATLEEHAKGLDVVRSHFTVTLGEGFSADPSQWDHRL